MAATAAVAASKSREAAGACCAVGAGSAGQAWAGTDGEIGGRPR